MKIYIPKKRSGFTLVEILVVVALMAILAIVALMIINPGKQRKRLYDSQRKRDLGQFKGILDNYYLEHIAYPKGEDICYDTPTTGGVPNSCSCHICGLSGKKDALAPLLQQLYCDPEYPHVSYVYEYDCSSDFPLWYKIFAQLSIDPSEGAAGTNSCNFGVTNKSIITPYSNSCSDAPSAGPGGGGGGGGGGPTPTRTPTPPVPTATPTSIPATPTPPGPTAPSCPADPVPKYCLQGSVCNICGTFSNCQSGGTCNNPLQLYSDGGCVNTCQ